MPHPHDEPDGASPVFASTAMVAAPHALASEAGLAMLRRGGSAVDAAIAIAAVLGVAYPHMTGIGGDGFWSIHDPRSACTHALNASGPAAALATRTYFRERGCAEIPARGALAALTVPGAVDGWRAVHERFGRLAWSELLAPAIRLATEGVPVGRSLGRWMRERAALVDEHPEARRVLLPRGPLAEGERLAQPALARTLETIARYGPRALYEGALPACICDALAPGGSPLRPGDFAAYAAEWCAPIESPYRGLTVQELPPNTQGMAALQMLSIAEGYDVAAWGDGSPDYYHYMAEAAKLANADRDAWCADPRFIDVPLARLLDPAYIAARRAGIRGDRALPPADIAPGIPFTAAARRLAIGGDTVYFCAVDPDGLVVSAIESLYLDLGSCAVGGDTGVILQNRGALFSLDDAAANRLEPGKRPFHTLIPAVVLRDGEPWAALGAMGGNGQPQTHAALLTRMVDFGWHAQRAIDAPRWVMGRTLESREERLWLEGRAGDAVAAELRRRGHRVVMVDDWSPLMGHAQVIRIHRRAGVLEGGADPRGDGAALGW